MVNLDWALANMDGKSKKTVPGSSSEWGREAESKGGNDLVKFIYWENERPTYWRV